MTPEQAIEKFEPTISVWLEQIEAEVVLDCGVHTKKSEIRCDDTYSYSQFFGLPDSCDWDAEVEFEIDIGDAWNGNGQCIQFVCSIYLNGKEVDYVRPMEIKPPPSLDDDLAVEQTFKLFKSMVDTTKISRMMIDHLKKEKK